ncbi:MAG: alpha/beta hydrolase [Deltaproteobacteria bacterium]|nr:alpha/beta hydrolase [Deltaproteobacteria bacterium]
MLKRVRRRGQQLRDALRQRAGAVVVSNFFKVGARAMRAMPRRRPHPYGVDVVRDVPYLSTGRVEHLLDIYRPVGAPRPAPVVFYVHGGGFRILSKDSHWMMAEAFAQKGYLVFNVNYRLAPKHPYPAAIEDCAAALVWVAKNAAACEGDLGRLVLAGESAGANLVTALAVILAYPRPEPWAQELFATGLRPRAVLPNCGMLQVSDPERFRRRKPRMRAWVFDRLAEVPEGYLRGVDPSRPGGHDLADPLLVLEGSDAPAHPLPPFFAAVGTRDPLLDDTRRLKVALDAHGVPCETRYYPGELHAFHALVVTAAAKQCWQDQFDFLDRHVAEGPAGERRESAEAAIRAAAERLAARPTPPTKASFASRWLGRK